MGFDFSNLGGLADKAKDMSALPKMWEDVKGKDWQSFHERILTARERGEAEPEQLEKVEHAGLEAESSGKQFPDSLPGLMDTLKDHMPGR